MIEELSRKLGYTFTNESLLIAALTHRSHNENNNERLEFLGDSIINFIIAEALFHQFPKAQEGDLSRWRASLINRDTLAELGRDFDLGRYMNLGMGELKSGGAGRASIISCCMEAIVGAIYLDSNFETVRERAMAWYHAKLSAITEVHSLKDPKTQLQELLQKKHIALPVYAVESVEGELHQQVFTVSCTVQDKQVLGKGSNRRRAEQESAVNMIEALKK